VRTQFPSHANAEVGSFTAPMTKLIPRARVLAALLVLAFAFYWLAWPYVGDLLFGPSLRGPYQIDFGRGSGQAGYWSVSVRWDGTVIECTPSGDLSRKKRTFKLPSDALRKIEKSVLKNKLLRLKNEYRDPEIVDGSLWTFRISSAWGDMRETDFHNRFPKQIVRFANELDAVLAASEVDAVQWQRSDFKDQDCCLP
jgi:hypothetical protein